MMRILDGDGGLHPAIDSDPRVTESQGQSMLRVARQDADAEVVGMDAKLRPVIRARLGGAKAPSDFALFAGGRPTAVTTPIVEEWA